MAKQVGYVLSEIGWEYNDENYHRPECDGGTPRKVYLNKQKAMTACAELNTTKTAENTKDGDYYQMEDGRGQQITDFYEVVEVEMEA